MGIKDKLLKLNLVLKEISYYQLDLMELEEYGDLKLVKILMFCKGIQIKYFLQMFLIMATRSSHVQKIVPVFYGIKRKTNDFFIF